ncbi:hypothetical protein ACS0TY_003810 [Phlomoides rotata]
MAALASFSPHLILRRFILSRPTHAALVSQAKQSFLPLRTTPYFTSTRFISLSPASDVALLDSVETESEDGESNSVDASAAVSEGLIKTPPPPPPPSLSVKEKKELASYAHSLGKKLKSQQVGKSGVTDFVVTALIETLEANELLKLKIHNSCPGELEDAVKKLEESTGSVAVGQIGRTVILYRPSLAKLKAEEKKKQVKSVYLKRQPVLQQSPQSRRAPLETGQEPRQSTRGRRGSSRF